MRILYLMFSYTVGGTERLVTDICNDLVLKKNEVYLYIVNDLIDDTMIQKVNPKVHIKRYGRTVGSKDKLKVLFELARYIKKEKIDIVHCNALNTPELLLVTKIIAPHVKVVYTIHGMNQYGQLNKLKIRYRNIICDQIIAISESVKKDIINAGAMSKKVTVVYNAIDFKRIDNNLPQTHTFDKNKVVIGNVARFEPEIKGQDILLDAMGKLIKLYPQIKCLFAGAPDKGHYDQYVSLKERMEKKYPNNISFMGNIDDVAGFLKKIDIFVLPSRFEGFGLSLVEAMSMGVPCVASKLAGPEEVLEYGKRGSLFEAENSNELVSKIEYVIENYSEEKCKAQENRSYVRNKYDIRNMTKQLISIYDGADTCS